MRKAGLEGFLLGKKGEADYRRRQTSGSQVYHHLRSCPGNTTTAKASNAFVSMKMTTGIQERKDVANSDKGKFYVHAIQKKQPEKGTM